MIFEKLKTYHNPDRELQSKLIVRPRINTKSLSRVIEDVFDNVQSRGDEALIQYAKEFDQALLSKLKVSPHEIKEAVASIDSELKKSIEIAYSNIHAFHKHQILKSEVVETTVGVKCWQESRPIEKVGLYIPGGTAPLFSTVLMLAIPAQIAGCQEVVLCTPPDKNGNINPAILYTAHRCGIKCIIKSGGSQAIAAMVFGTESVPQVYKIFGPGNQYVMAAKMKAMEYGVSIDLPAGPSEVLVLADEYSNASYIASDLLSQAEHGTDSQVVFVTTSNDLVLEVEKEISEQLSNLNRKSIAGSALKHAYCVVFDNIEVAFSFINYYAPEHLIISTNNSEEHIKKVISAGSVFLGNLTPESAGDYASGTNHTLPTSSYARSYSGVSLDSFIKKITFQKITKIGLKNIGPSIINMAMEEHLDAHANAVKIRLTNIDS